MSRQFKICFIKIMHIGRVPVLCISMDISAETGPMRQSYRRPPPEIIRMVGLRESIFGALKFSVVFTLPSFLWFFFCFLCVVGLFFLECHTVWHHK